MIGKPLFEILDYSFPAFFFLENKGYDRKAHVSPELSVTAGIMLCEGKKNIWRVSLEVATPKDLPPASFPYEFSAFATATIKTGTLQKGQDALVLKKLLYVNGASVLYSAARERLSLFFNPRHLPHYTLPTFRFDPDDIIE